MKKDVYYVLSKGGSRWSCRLSNPGNIERKLMEKIDLFDFWCRQQKNKKLKNSCINNVWQVQLCCSGSSPRTGSTEVQAVGCNLCRRPGERFKSPLV